jgi:hypothetical protein
MSDFKTSTKKKKGKVVYENPFEAFVDIGRGIKDQITTQSQEGAREAWIELFGADKKETRGGDLRPGQEIDFTKHDNKAIEKQAENIRGGIDYIGELLRAGEKKPEQESRELQEQIQNLILEIKSLAGATSALEKQVTEATGQQIVSPGRYHKTFFQWVISVIKDARTKIDNANVWLSTMKGKQKGRGKQKKTQNYWDMAKQHGSKFTLSGERAVASQTG